MEWIMDRMTCRFEVIDEKSECSQFPAENVSNLSNFLQIAENKKVE